MFARLPASISFYSEVRIICCPGGQQDRKDLGNYDRIGATDGGRCSILSTVALTVRTCDNRRRHF